MYLDYVLRKKILEESDSEGHQKAKQEITMISIIAYIKMSGYI